MKNRKEDPKGILFIPQEKLILQFLSEFKCNNYFDIGASLSISSQYLFDNIIKNSKTKIIAFEPSSKGYSDFVSRYGEHNKLKIYNLALGNKNEEKNLYCIDGDFCLSTFVDVKNSQWKELKKHRDKLLNRGSIILNEKVNVEKLDSFIKKEKLPYPDIIKIDTEGWEEQVVRGARETIKRCNPFIFIEFHSKDSSHVVHKIFDKISGYKFITLWRKKDKTYKYHIFYHTKNSTKINKAISELSRIDFSNFYSVQSNSL